MEKIPSKPSIEASKPETRLRGHIGHLTKEEAVAFKEFKDLCAKEGLYTTATPNAISSHDDATLMRYLRARRFVPKDALAQFKDTEQWRKENDLDALYEKIDIKDYAEARTVYPQWTGRRDKRGIPVYLYEVGKLDSKKMLAYTSSASKSTPQGSSPSRMLRLFALYENLTRFVMPLCTAAPGRPNPETPVDQSNNIVDISRVGLKQFWNLKSHMQDASQLATAHYPETLDRIFIIGAPAFFPTVWSWIKRWFDPITTSKIFVLSSSQVLPTLTQFIDVENIPKKYGGQLNFRCGDTPNLDPELREYLTIDPAPDSEKLFLTAPVRWNESGEDGEMQAIGVGTSGGVQRKEAIATLQGVARRVATHTERLSRATTAATIPTINRPVSQQQSTPRTSHNAPSSPLATVPPQTTSADVQPSEKAPVAAKSADTHIPTPEDNQAAVTLNGATVVPNGAPQPAAVEDKKKLSMPPPAAELSRQETVYMTPATEPSEIKTMS